VKPDAMFIPAGRRVGKNVIERVGSIADIAEPILGGKAYIRQQPHGWLFVTADPDDTIMFPTGDVRSGPRYVWIAQPDGIRFGYLRDEHDQRIGQA
jgi:hypothetical protein